MIKTYGYGMKPSINLIKIREQMLSQIIDLAAEEEDMDKIYGFDVVAARSVRENTATKTIWDIELDRIFPVEDKKEDGYHIDYKGYHFLIRDEHSERNRYDFTFTNKYEENNIILYYRLCVDIIDKEKKQ